MVATRGRTFKRPWRRSCLSSKLKSSSAPIGRKDSWCFHAVGSSNAPLLGSTAAEGLQRIGRTSIATRWRSCGLPQSASCCENFVIPPDVFGQTLNKYLRFPEQTELARTATLQSYLAAHCVEGKPRASSRVGCLSGVKINEQPGSSVAILNQFVTEVRSASILLDVAYLRARNDGTSSHLQPHSSTTIL